MSLKWRTGSGGAGMARRLGLLAAKLLLAALLAVPASNSAQAQGPTGKGVTPLPGTELALVNEEEDFVERKKDGRFIARPVFDRELDVLHYGVRDSDTGDWLTAVYRVQGGEKKRKDGWEYSWEYPFEDEQPGLDPERAYLLVILARETGVSDPGVFHAVIPVHQPGGLWNKVLRSLDPGRWARAFARWTIEGVHGTLCGVVEKAAGEDADNCGEG